MSLGYAEIEAALAAEGLIARGGFHPGGDDTVPALPTGEAPRTLVLAGNAGTGLWPAFSASAEASDGGPDPLDRWSARVLAGLAADLGAAALFPFGGPPYLPFQRWALRAEPVAPSPLGVLIHPVYGLWHAYRGALAFAERIELPSRPEQASPCDGCRDQPCLSACPVGAFTADGYALAACVGHISGRDGQDCLTLSCRTRHACPVGQEFVYEPAQAGFHMAAFLGARLRGKP